MNIPPVSPVAKRNEDFAILQNTLQSGNLPAAQGAFAAFQQDVQKTTLTSGPGSLFSPGTQASKDLQTLGVNLKSANLTGAQKAFATLVQDIQSGGVTAAPPAGNHGRHALTQAEVANNGVAVPDQSASAQAVRYILDNKA